MQSFIFTFKLRVTLNLLICIFRPTHTLNENTDWKFAYLIVRQWYVREKDMISVNLQISKQSWIKTTSLQLSYDFNVRVHITSNNAQHMVKTRKKTETNKVR